MGTMRVWDVQILGRFCGSIWLKEGREDWGKSEAHVTVGYGERVW